MRWHKTISALIVGLLLLSLGHISHASDDRLARETVDRVARLFSGKSSIATLQMQIFGENGQRDLAMKIWTQGDDALVLSAQGEPHDQGSFFDDDDLVDGKRFHS
jgi:hypothetical protein